MMPEIPMPKKLSADLRRKIDRIEKMTNVEEVLAAIAEGLTMTVAGILLAATGMRRLQELGAEIDGIYPNLGLVSDIIRPIAHGQLLGGLVIKYFRPGLLELFRRLTIPDQERLLEDKSLKLMTGKGDDHKLVHPSELDNEQLRQLIDFKKGKFRTEVEQIRYLEKKNGALPLQLREQPEIDIDHKRRGIVVSLWFQSSQGKARVEKFIPVDDMASYVAKITAAHVRR